MNEELMITQQDLIEWLDRPPSNDDLDLATFISTRLENFYKLEEQLQQKENIIKEVREYIYNNSFDEERKEIIDELWVNEIKDILEILDKVD